MFSVSFSWSSGPSKQSLEIGEAESVVGFFKDPPRGRIGIGQRLAHAGGLRALAGEQKCSFRGQTEIIAGAGLPF